MASVVDVDGKSGPRVFYQLRVVIYERSRVESQSSRKQRFELIIMVSL